MLIVFYVKSIVLLTLDVEPTPGPSREGNKIVMAKKAWDDCELIGKRRS
jgi:hypothetical protein